MTQVSRQLLSVRRYAASVANQARALAHRLIPARDSPSDSHQSSPYPFARRDEIRLREALPFLRVGAVGFEIGAGAFPSLLPDGVTCEYFDRLDHAQLSQYFGGAALPHTESVTVIAERFPDGADFILAHNVLEHTPDPIGTLMQWFEYLKPGGVAVISVPHRNFCPGDARRPIASIEHLLIDFAMREDATSLQSREHFIAGCVGWASDWPDVTKNDFANGILEAASGRSPEHHFHVFDDDITRDVVKAALAFGGVGQLVSFASPNTLPSTEGDIIAVVELRGHPDTVPAIGATRDALAVAANRLRLPTRRR